MLKLWRGKPGKQTRLGSLPDSTVFSLRTKQGGKKKEENILHVNLIYANSGLQVSNQLLVKHSDVLKEFFN